MEHPNTSQISNAFIDKGLQELSFNAIKVYLSISRESQKLPKVKNVTMSVLDKLRMPLAIYKDAVEELIKHNYIRG